MVRDYSYEDDDLVKKNNMDVGDVNGNMYTGEATRGYEFDSLWFKALDYEIKDGVDAWGDSCKYISPIGNGEHERYLPVVGERGSKTDAGKTKVIHYKTLINLFNNLEDDNAILDFYREYGPLGLLHHNVQSIKKYGRFRLKADNKLELMPLQDLFYRIHSGWMQETYTVIDPNGPLLHAYKNKQLTDYEWNEKSLLVNNLLSQVLRTADHASDHQFYDPDELIPAELEMLELDAQHSEWEPYNKPYIMHTRTPFTGRPTLDPIAYGLTAYFNLEKKDRATHDYPCPFTYQFAQEYVEQLEFFKLIVSQFTDLYAVICEPKRFEDDVVADAFKELNAGNDVDVYATNSEERLNYHSLFGCFVFSMMDGLSHGKGIGRCQGKRPKSQDTCGRVFVQNANGTKRFCSDKCGGRTRQRQHRSR